MSRICPQTGQSVLYVDCLECDEKEKCRRNEGSECRKSNEPCFWVVRCRDLTGMRKSVRVFATNEKQAKNKGTLKAAGMGLTRIVSCVCEPEGNGKF